MMSELREGLQWKSLVSRQKDSSFVGMTICDDKIEAKSLTLVVAPKKRQ